MKFKQGKQRNGMVLIPLTLEEQITIDNPVRQIDAFIEGLDLVAMGFDLARYGANGRPAYHPKLLLKIFIYGYMNSVRSSRQLERYCHINLEMKWLTEELAPDHNTISNFRRDHAVQIKNVFNATVELADGLDLIGGKIIAGDSTKLRAQNSKKNNYNAKKIKRHLKYIDEKLTAYNAILDADETAADKDDKHNTDAGSAFAKAEQEKAKHLLHKAKYEALSKELENSGENQISTSDPESRHMITRGVITEVVYNVQATTDAEHCIPINYEVTNENDKKAMGAMLEQAVEILEPENGALTALFDKGYHTGSEFKNAADLGVETLVAIPGRSSRAPHEDYNSDRFSYDEAGDFYTCPQGHDMTSNGKWYTARNYEFKQYKTTNCKGCPVRDLCTSAKVNGRILQRSEHQEHVEANAVRVSENEELYKRRQAIVEHPFGTIKRQWGFDHIMTKRGKERASADVGLIFIAYNLTRIWNIMKKKQVEKAGLNLFKKIQLLSAHFLHCKPAKISIHLYFSN